MGGWVGLSVWVRLWSFCNKVDRWVDGGASCSPAHTCASATRPRLRMAFLRAQDTEQAQPAADTSNPSPAKTVIVCAHDEHNGETLDRARDPHCDTCRRSCRHNAPGVDTEPQHATLTDARQCQAHGRGPMCMLRTPTTTAGR